MRPISICLLMLFVLVGCDNWEEEGFANKQEAENVRTRGYDTFAEFVKGGGFKDENDARHIMELGFYSRAEHKQVLDFTPKRYRSECKSDGPYENCIKKKMIWSAFISTFSDNNGQRFDVAEDCYSERAFTVDSDMPNMTADEGKCVTILASPKKRNILYDDITIHKVISKEEDSEMQERLAIKKENEAKRREQKIAMRAEELESNKSNGKWLSENYQIEAGAACQSKVEALSKWDYEWTDGWLETKFPDYGITPKQPFVLTVSGSKIKFQNGFGAWQKVQYYCDYNVKSQATYAYAR
jgi:hypothetical protein